MNSLTKVYRSHLLNNRGSLIISMLVIFVMMLVAVSVLTLVTNEKPLTKLHLEGVSSTYQMESGGEIFVYRLRKYLTDTVVTTTDISGTPADQQVRCNQLYQANVLTSSNIYSNVVLGLVYSFREFGLAQIDVEDFIIAKNNLTTPPEIFFTLKIKHKNSTQRPLEFDFKLASYQINTFDDGSKLICSLRYN